jgi:hypothetical protein
VFAGVTDLEVVDACILEKLAVVTNYNPVYFPGFIFAHNHEIRKLA